MKNLKIALFGLSIICATAQASAAELVSNGGFESNTVTGSATNTFSRASQGLTGWTIGVNNVDLVSNLLWAPASGVNSLDLNGTKKGEIHQALNTVVGQTYQLSFDLAGNFLGGLNTKNLSVNVGSNGLYSFNTTGRTATTMGWTNYVTTFIASTAQTNLSFSSNTSGTYGPALDNISVTAVPEPETYAMLLAGLGLMGAIARRRNQSKAG